VDDVVFGWRGGKYSYVTIHAAGSLSAACLR